jgi:hypothetical protein
VSFATNDELPLPFFKIDADAAPPVSFVAVADVDAEDVDARCRWCLGWCCEVVVLAWCPVTTCRVT